MNLLEEYVIAPMASGAGYNLLNTALVAGLLILAALLLLKAKFLRKRLQFLPGDLLPFIVAGAAVRSLEDACFYPCGWPEKALFITPGIWILSFLIFLVLERFAPRRARLVGWLLAAANLAIAAARFSNIWGLSLVLGFAAIVSAVFFGPLARLVRLPAGYPPVMLAHIFDGSSTFVAVRFFGYSEEHVLGRALIAAGGPSLFYLVKLAGIFAILLILGRMKLDKGEESVALAALLALGLGPGIRNTLSLAMGA